MGFENAKKVLKHMNRLDIPIYIGADKPLSKTYINALDTHGADGLGESFLDNVEGIVKMMMLLPFYPKHYKRIYAQSLRLDH